MIRINLVAEGRKPIAARIRKGPRFSFEAQNAATWALLIGFVAIGLTYGTYWFSLNRKISSREAEKAAVQLRVAELQTIIDQVERFTARKEELEHRIEVIGDLRDNQRGPVRILDQVSRALPDLLWLDQLSLTARAVTIAGRSFTTNSVASFIENLDRVEEFQEPILKSTSLNGQVYSFQIVFNYKAVPIRAVRPPEGSPPAREQES